MRARTFFVLLIFVFKSSAQEIDSTRKSFLDNEKIVLRDTVYLDTLIIDNETKLFTSKKWIAKYSVDEILFRQIIYNNTKNALELSATGNFVPVYEKEIKPFGYARISYHLYLKGRAGARRTEGTITYKPKHSEDSEYKQIGVILTGIKEYERTIRLDTLFIANTSEINHLDNIQCRKGEQVMFQFIAHNPTNDTLSFTVTTNDEGGLRILDYQKKILAPMESESIYVTLKTWSLKGKFSDGINIEYLPVLGQDSVSKMIKWVISGQVND